MKEEVYICNEGCESEPTNSVLESVVMAKKISINASEIYGNRLTIQ